MTHTLKEIEGLVDEYGIAENVTGGEHFADVVNARDALLSAIRAVMQDAERYRWLFKDDGNGVMARVNRVYWGSYDGRPENWDAAIDAARAGSGS